MNDEPEYPHNPGPPREVHEDAAARKMRSEHDMLHEISPLGGYAHGKYSCTCRKCSRRFTGDKRAWRCLPCALHDHAEQARAEEWEQQISRCERIIREAQEMIRSHPSITETMRGSIKMMLAVMADEIRNPEAPNE